MPYGSCHYLIIIHITQHNEVLTLFNYKTEYIEKVITLGPHLTIVPLVTAHDNHVLHVHRVRGVTVKLSSCHYPVTSHPSLSPYYPRIQDNALSLTIGTLTVDIITMINSYRLPIHQTNFLRRKATLSTTQLSYSGHQSINVATNTYSGTGYTIMVSTNCGRLSYNNGISQLW